MRGWKKVGGEQLQRQGPCQLIKLVLSQCSVGNETVASLTTILHIFGICPASWNEEIFMFADKY